MATGSSVLDSVPLHFELLSRSKLPSLRLFCFPYAGGSADVYRSWRGWFPEQLEICLVHLPGRGRSIGAQALTRLTPLVKTSADYIDRETTVPYALYGHSMGALICFELARELFSRQRTVPQHLFVSGRRAPQWPIGEPKTFHLPHDQFLTELRKLNGTPEEFLNDPELMNPFLGAIRADFEVVETYEYCPGEPLPCPITVYGGLEDKHVPLESCHAWRQQTSATCKVRMFKGDHFFIRNPVADFIAAFRSDLLRAAPTPHAENLK